MKMGFGASQFWAAFAILLLIGVARNNFVEKLTLPLSALCSQGESGSGNRQQRS